MLRRLLLTLTALSLLLGVAMVLTPRPSAAHWLLLVLWFACIFAMVLVAIPFRKEWDREQRVRLGLCPSCGYDLTANVSGTCPECGQAVATGAK